MCNKDIKNELHLCKHKSKMDFTCKYSSIKSGRAYGHNSSNKNGGILKMFWVFSYICYFPILTHKEFWFIHLATINSIGVLRQLH